jgi:hypothetical protein
VVVEAVVVLVAVAVAEEILEESGAVASNDYSTRPIGKGERSTRLLPFSFMPRITSAQENSSQKNSNPNSSVNRPTWGKALGKMFLPEDNSDEVLSLSARTPGQVIRSWAEDTTTTIKTGVILQ